MFTYPRKNKERELSCYLSKKKITISNVKKNDNITEALKRISFITLYIYSRLQYENKGN